MMKKIFFILTIALLTVSCRQQSSFQGFTVSGEIAQADGKTLYFDRLGATSSETVDSVKLDESGRFSFTQPRPECYDFYRLRIDRQMINLAVDSTENIVIKAELPAMGTGYSVEGSETCQELKKLVLKQMQFQKEIDAMTEAAGVEIGVLQNKVNEKVDVFKSQLMTDYIYADYESPCAYYALFMRINGTPLFNPQTSRQDAKCFAALATVLSMKHPDAVRIQHLQNIALKGMKMTARPLQSTDDATSEYLSSIISESGIIEIELPDMNGVRHKLSDLKGKVVLLDFTAYKTDFSAEYNLMLRSLYDKYASQGFEIYQVSVDSDSHFWLTSAANLPWICVYDENSLEADCLLDYRIETLPSAFLINRDNEIVERMEDYRELDAHIASLLD